MPSEFWYNSILCDAHEIAHFLIPSLLYGVPSNRHCPSVRSSAWKLRIIFSFCACIYGTTREQKWQSPVFERIFYLQEKRGNSPFSWIFEVLAFFQELVIYTVDSPYFEHPLSRTSLCLELKCQPLCVGCNLFFSLYLELSLSRTNFLVPYDFEIERVNCIR